MTIYLDAMGGDNAPVEIIQGAVDAVKEYGINVTLIGDETIINNVFTNRKLSKDNISIIDAKENISMNEEPVAAVRKKKDSPMVVGCTLVKGSHEDAFVSAGSTGALLSAALLYSGRIKGVQRPALCTVVNINKPVALLDNGANADCKADYLVQFAKMGAAYTSIVTGIKEPKVGLLNIGSEDIKGNSLYKEAHQLLREDGGVDFVGNVEANHVNDSEADVIVCDGFTGNVLLKNMEGSFKTALNIIKDVFYKNTPNKVAAMIVKKDLSEKKAALDPKAYGGAPLLGINATVIKAHGNSDAYAIKNALYQANKLLENDVLGKIIETLK